MPDTASALRPVPNGALTPSAGPGVARDDRRDPFPALIPDWQEVIAWDITVNATTEEGVTSRTIYGPFAVVEFALRSSAAGSLSQLVKLATGDTSPAGQSVQQGDSSPSGQLMTDTSRTVPSFYATAVFERHRLRWIQRGAQTRLQIIVNNGTAAGVTIVGHIIIQHLREARPGEHADW